MALCPEVSCCEDPGDTAALSRWVFGRRKVMFASEEGRVTNGLQTQHPCRDREGAGGVHDGVIGGGQMGLRGSGLWRLKETWMG